MSNTYQELSTTIGEARPAILSLTIPDLPFPALRHAHSILSIHRNALICKRKSFPPMLEIRTPTRQKFFAYDFKGKFARFEFSYVSASIDNDRSIFSRAVQIERGRQAQKKTVTSLLSHERTTEQGQFGRQQDCLSVRIHGFTSYRRSRNPRPSKIAGIAFSIRAVRVSDCFAPPK